MTIVKHVFTREDGSYYEFAVTQDEKGIRLTGPELDYTLTVEEAVVLRQLLQLLEPVYKS